MNAQNPVIAIIGAGAIGGYYGARLIQHGHNVHLLARTDHQTIRTAGMRIQSLDGDFNLAPAQINVYAKASQMPKADLVIVTLKTTANDQLDSLIRPLLKPDTAILTLQNGLGNEQILADLFGAKNILGGMAFVCINRVAPGHIVHSDHGLIRLGEFCGSAASDRAEKIAKIFSASNVPCKVLDNLAYGRWEKIIWNVPFNGLGALLDLTTDQLIGCEPGLAMVRQLMREIIAIAKTTGVQMPDSIVELKIEHTRTMGAYKSSMQIDRQMHRPMEIEAILGQPLRAAQTHHVASPALAALYSLLNLLQAAAVR
jgi:2-dehydropantoate 2-reductase